MKLRTILNKREGVSLIEILAALAVFTIGILIIVRIYPGGFGLLRQTAYATLTDRMAQAEIERIQGGGGMPAGILSGFFQDDGSFQFVDSDFENMEDSYASTDAATTYKNVNKFHYVFEEQTQIPNAHVVSAFLPDSSSYYYVKFSPIDVRKADSVIPQDTVRISAYSGPMNQMDVPAGAVIPGFGPANYAVDYTNHVLYVSVDTTKNRRFYISYTYQYTKDGASRHATILCQPIDIAAGASIDTMNGYQSVIIPLPPNADSMFAGKYPGSATVRRGFKLLANGDAWASDPNDPDPYQFKIIDSVRGIIAFNPNGYGYKEDTASGLQTLAAYISYGVLDWHILHEDKKLPTQPIGTVNDEDTALNIRMTLGSIKRMQFSAEADGSRFAGLCPDFPALQYDVIVADLDEGAVYSFKHPDSGDPVVGTTPDGKPAFNVDYKNGILHFSPYLYGHSVRIYYQASGDWGMAAYRSFDTLTRLVRDDSDTTPVMLNQGQYFRGSNDYTTHAEEYGKLFFPRSYAGLEVSLDYTYLVPGETTPRIVSGEIRRISDATDDKMSDPMCFIDLASPLNAKFPTDTHVVIMPESMDHAPMTDAEMLSNHVGPDDGQIRRVRGISLGVRVVRKDMGIFKGGHWKYSDLQTSLSTAR